MAALQADVQAPRAQELVKHTLALAADRSALAPEAREIRDQLAGWDGRAAPESVGAAAYHVFLERLTRRVLEQQLGPELSRRYAALPQADPEQVVLDLVAAAAQGKSEDAREVAAEAVRAALRETWFQLSYHMGPNRRKWSWGRLHALDFREFVPASPGLIGKRALGPHAYGGNGSTIAAAEYHADEGYGVRVASTFRFAIDTAALDEALIGLAPGTSEHPGHPDYDRGLARWLEGRPELLATSRLFVEEVSPARIVLRPVSRPAP
jgi:penicillin amidase